ncbi:MAG: NADH:ubiquinone oxidoreductase [Planctomycetota bacterium]
MSQKPRIAFFDFTSCEGCQLQVINCETEIPELIGMVDIVNFREAMSERSDNYDIAFIEGSITTDAEVDTIKKIRQNAKIIVALGACACIGGVNCLKNHYTIDQVKKMVYGKDAGLYSTIPTRPIDQVIPVDYYIRGCPISKAEFLKVTKALLLGKKPEIPNVPVCAECKLAENVCVFEKGKFCLGPVTLAGCNAICPSNNDGCEGCRGFMNQSNINSEKDILKKYGLSVDDMTARFNMYNNCMGEGVK